MNNDIKEIFDRLRHTIITHSAIDMSLSEYGLICDCINRLQEENERLKEQNNDLRKIYGNTYQRLFDNGNDELARYFQAQIDDCPTFYVEPIIDYHKEWKDYKSRNEKAIEYIHKNYYEVVYKTKGTMENDLLNILNGGDDNE